MSYDWPDEVLNYYGALADARGWNQDTVTAFANTVEMVRQLSLTEGPRRYFAAEADSTQYLFECVDHEGHQLPVRQIEIEADGSRRLYSWQRLEDKAGGLSESAIDTSAVREIDAESFTNQWR